MTVEARQYRNQQGSWEVDIMLTFPGRPPVRSVAKAIQELAGHASITATERYTHLGPDVVREVIEGLRPPDDRTNVGEARPSALRSQ